MQYKLILGLILFTSTILFSSCATIFNGVKAKITVDDHGMREPVTLTVDGEKTYSHSQLLALNYRCQRLRLGIGYNLYF